MPESPQSYKSAQDIYAKYLISRRGYPLWFPEPNSELPEDYQNEGFRIGDVGVVEDGSFDVLFNICLPPDHPLHGDYGVPNNFEPIPLRNSDVATNSDAEDPGCVISTSSVTQVNPVEQRSDYNFRLSSSEGALLILPQGSDRHRLRNDLRRFGEHAIQNAVEWYRFAEEEHGRIIAHDSLYLITGFYKARSWSLASFQDAAGSGDFPAQFKVTQAEDGGIVGGYVWSTTRALDKRVGPRRYNGLANQAVFISGFKIAVTDEALGKKRVAVTTAVPSVQSHHGEFTRVLQEPDEYGETTDSTHPTQGSSKSQGKQCTFGHTSVQHLPPVSQSFHPSDTINQYLLRKDPSATVAITHDSQWIRMLENGRLEPYDFIHARRIEEILAEEYTTVSHNGAVYLQSAISGATIWAWDQDASLDREINGDMLIAQDSTQPAIKSDQLLVPKSSLSSSLPPSQEAISQNIPRTSAPKAKGPVHAKSGCYTCRIRRKKCDERMNSEGSCDSCVRLRLQCLGFGTKRPEWLQESRNVSDLREKIKTFLASQRMIKSNSGSGPHAPEQERQILVLSPDHVPPIYIPQAKAPPAYSTNNEQPSTSYPLQGRQYFDNDRLPDMQCELSPDSPPERSEHPEVLLPAVPFSPNAVFNSIDSWPNHSYTPQRPHTSAFSRWYTAPVPEEDEIDVVSSGYSLTPPVDWPMLDDRQNAALDYYVKHVLHAQYLHASESLGSNIWRLIHTSDNAREAACLLSDLHRKSVQEDRLGIVDAEDLEVVRRMQTIPFKSPLTEGDAFAGLCIVSYILVKGGKGQWQTFLDVACTYSLSVLNDPRWGGPCKVLLRCSESLRFIIKTSMWFDVLASATLVREPRFLEVIRELYGPKNAFFDAQPTVPMKEYSMMFVMGCENHIVLALAEIACLASWKDAHVNSGSLSVIELVKRGHRIEELLKTPSSHNYESDISMDSAEKQRARQRCLTSEVFRASTHVYLHSVVSDYPRCPEIIEAVNDTVRCLMDAEDGQTGRTVVRSAVFSICICGCLTEDPLHQAYFIRRLQEQQGLFIGSSQQVSCLIREVWMRRYERGAVDWRQVVREAEMLLV